MHETSMATHHSAEARGIPRSMGMRPRIRRIIPANHRGAWDRPPCSSFPRTLRLESRVRWPSRGFRLARVLRPAASRADAAPVVGAGLACAVPRVCGCCRVPGRSTAAGSCTFTPSTASRLHGSSIRWSERSKHCDATMTGGSGSRCTPAAWSSGSNRSTSCRSTWRCCGETRARAGRARVFPSNVTRPGRTGVRPLHLTVEPHHAPSGRHDVGRLRHAGVIVHRPQGCRSRPR